MMKQARARSVVLMSVLLSLTHAQSPVISNQKVDGYQGIWFDLGQRSQYGSKYSGGLGTYTAKHVPLAIYAPEAHRTFFVYGGTDEKNSTLLHMVSYFDHTTGTVPRPTFLLDKETEDAHDNPVLSIDAAGHLWIFSSSHGTSRPSFIHRSRRPYDVDAFEAARSQHQDLRIILRQVFHQAGNLAVHLGTAQLLIIGLLTGCRLEQRGAGQGGQYDITGGNRETHTQNQ